MSVDQLPDLPDPIDFIFGEQASSRLVSRRLDEPVAGLPETNAVRLNAGELRHRPHRVEWDVARHAHTLTPFLRAFAPDNPCLPGPAPVLLTVARRRPCPAPLTHIPQIPGDLRYDADCRASAKTFEHC